MLVVLCLDDINTKYRIYMNPRPTLASESIRTVIGHRTRRGQERAVQEETRCPRRPDSALSRLRSRTGSRAQDAREKRREKKKQKDMFRIYPTRFLCTGITPPQTSHCPCSDKTVSIPHVQFCVVDHSYIGNKTRERGRKLNCCTWE